MRDGSDAAAARRAELLSQLEGLLKELKMLGVSEEELIALMRGGEQT